MKKKTHIIVLSLLLPVLLTSMSPQTLLAQGTAFSYQGRLSSGGAFANGSYDLIFRLFATNTTGAAIAAPVTNSAVAVTNGLFTTLIDFGPGIFTGGSNWIELAVSTNGVNNFSTLAPRQQITPTPYAITAASANSLPGLAVQLNASSGAPNLIGGSPVNFVSTGVVGATIGGGGATNIYAGKPYPYAYTNSVTGSFGTVSGGAVNTAGAGATVGGGQNNSASGQFTTVAGGYGNSASGTYSAVGGGAGNLANGSSLGAATVAGGSQNTASDTATVGGGFNNQATNSFATVPGGTGNVAGGQSSFAAGNNALALHAGAFVWADSEGPFASTTTNQFNVRANGGVRFVTGGAGLTVDGQAVLTLFSDPGTINFFAGQSAGNGLVSGSHNIGVGLYSLLDITGGSYNTAAGVNTLQYDTLGSYNSGFGACALQWVTTGSNNTASGVFALSAEPTWLTGSGNTADGADVLYSLGSGYNNTAAGYQSLYTSSSDHDNVAMGVSTLFNLAGGNQNTAVGTYSFQNLTSGSGNVGLGYSAGNTLTSGNNNVYIANAGSSTENGVIRLGTPGTQVQTYLAGGVNLDPSGLNSGHITAYALTLGASSGEGIASQRTGGSPANGQYGLEFYTDYINQMTILQNGKVGIGTNSPSQQLEVNGNYVLVDGAAANNGSGPIDAYIGGNGSGSDVQIGSLNSNISNVAFYNWGNSSYMHIYCSSITVEGGSDLAEPFKVSTAEQPVAEGAVLVIDEAHPGQLKLADRPYDTRVAGVVSGANGIHPGIQMQQQGLLEGGRNVALSGRVYVQADTSNGPINPGDLLTTSGAAGRAMKVTDHAKAAGAILGKAMTALKAGQGMVLVLVTLQ